jgi:chorismate mutase
VGASIGVVLQDPELEALRREIDDIDERILELVAARVRIVLRVGELKRRVGLPVYDPERERAMLDRLAQRASPPLDLSTVRRVFERLIDESRRLEQNHFDR